MFGIGMPEMLLLLAVALIVFGPKKLPELAKSLGRALGEFKRATSDLKESIESETGVGEVRDSFKDIAADIPTPANLAGDVPDPTPAADTEPASAAQPEAGADDAAAPMEKVKAAFDELNSAKDESGDASPSDGKQARSKDDASS